MKNRFLEMDAYLRSASDARRKSFNQPVSTAKTAGAANTYRSYSGRRSGAFSIQQTALVILIENGGVDLGIPKLVDKILSELPGTSLIPDSVKENIVSFLRDKIKGFTDNLIETAELTLNRYNSAAPTIFNSVIILRNNTSTYQDLKATLMQLSRDNTIADVMILTHGGDNSIVVNGDISGQMIKDIKTENGAPLKIRSVYMMNCVGSSLNQAWLDAGAKVSCGSRENNYLPEPTTFFFWRNWKAGQSFGTAATGAFNETVTLMNDALKAALKLLPFGAGGASIDFHKFKFVIDSTPEVQGASSVTINSKDLSFSQSQSASQLITTVLPAKLLRSMQVSNAFEAKLPRDMSASNQCIDLIKRFEGFKQRKYNDAAGNCAIGYGTVLHAGKCNDQDESEHAYVNGITEMQATELLMAKLTEVQDTVKEAVKVELNQNQFDALVSFAQNVHSEGFKNSTLLRLLNEGNTGAVPDELKKWIHGKVGNNKTVIPQLVQRRNAEAALFQGSISAAKSFSLSNYSKPFYDTGEHALLGQYIDSVLNAPIANVTELSPSKSYLVGKEKNVPFTYGQIMTMGDFYADFHSMESASELELNALKNLIVRSENVYKNAIYKMNVGNAAEPTQKEWSDATNDMYLKLAAANNSHFAPPPATGAFASSKKPNNKSEWEMYHNEAILRCRKGNDSNDYDEALKINAFGDHFLTDAFAAGHLVNKEALINQFKALTLNHGKVNKAGTDLLDAIAKQSFTGPVADELSKYQTSQTKLKVHGFIDDANMFRTLLIGILEIKPDKISNLFVKAVHDALNEYNNKTGVPVVNAKGNSWELTGDATLNDKNMPHIQEAVMQSVSNVRDAVNNSSTSIADYQKMVWDFVPNPSHPKTKAVLDAVIKDYSDFKTNSLISKAVKLITAEYGELISELIKEKAIELREGGRWNNIGNAIGDAVN